MTTTLTNATTLKTTTPTRSDGPYDLTFQKVLMNATRRTITRTPTKNTRHKGSASPKRSSARNSLALVKSLSAKCLLRNTTPDDCGQESFGRHLDEEVEAAEGSNSAAQESETRKNTRRCSRTPKRRSEGLSSSKRSSRSPVRKSIALVKKSLSLVGNIIKLDNTSDCSERPFVNSSITMPDFGQESFVRHFEEATEAAELQLRQQSQQQPCPLLFELEFEPPTPQETRRRMSMDENIPAALTRQVSDSQPSLPRRRPSNNSAAANSVANSVSDQRPSVPGRYPSLDVSSLDVSSLDVSVLEEAFAAATKEEEAKINNKCDAPPSPAKRHRSYSLLAVRELGGPVLED